MNLSGLFQHPYQGVYRDAAISDCTRYRYCLKRWWDDDGERDRWACFVMLNPSTADAAKDDPTIRRCIGFARAWGCGGLSVVNLFAWRATDPAELARTTDPVGPDNHLWLRRATEETNGGPVVAAWGAHPFAAKRAADVAGVLALNGVALQCLGTTKDGHPRHPLYVRADAALVPYGKAGAR